MRLDGRQYFSRMRLSRSSMFYDDPPLCVSISLRTGAGRTRIYRRGERPDQPPVPVLPSARSSKPQTRQSPRPVLRRESAPSPSHITLQLQTHSAPTLSDHAFCAMFHVEHSCRCLDPDSDFDSTVFPCSTWNNLLLLNFIAKVPRGTYTFPLPLINSWKIPIPPNFR